MSIDKSKYAQFLDGVAEELDIPPSKHREAVEHYQAVGRWLEAGKYPGSLSVAVVYPQGSFRLGTVVRPIRSGVETDYDIDLVCELQILKSLTDARSIKVLVGLRLKEHDGYRKMLDLEGKRCWTLEYSEKDGIGFHMDVLPAVPDPVYQSDTAIAITDKQGSNYSWSASDPKGYAQWFDSKNRAAFGLVFARQKQHIQAREPTIYASIDDVPDQLVRTPLQRAIQLMKRHRDLHFGGRAYSEYAPISIIISTLAAQLYDCEPDVYSALRGIVSKLYAHVALLENSPAIWKQASTKLITRTPNGNWYIGNPVNSKENFADRWHEDGHGRASAFFSWVESLKKDLVDIVDFDSTNSVRHRLGTVLGAATVAPHVGLIETSPVVAIPPPRVHITTPAKPWGTRNS